MDPPHERTVVAYGVGFAALLVAVIAAHTAPATAYELSIYRSTPTVYWVGLAAALGISLFATLFGPEDGWTTGGAFLLAYASLLSFVALPILRGYYFLGAGDSLTHLGWVQDLATGTLDPLDFLYPAVHLTALLTSTLLGIEFARALQLVVVLFFVLFLLFVPLCVRAVTTNSRTATISPRTATTSPRTASAPRATCIGLFSAGLFLPVNNLGVFRMTYPFGQAVLLSPFLLYLLFLYVESEPERTILGISPTGIGLTGASVALVLIHPQLALGIVLLFVTLTGLQYGFRRWSPEHPIATHRSLGVPTVVAGAFYVIWVGNKPAVQHAAEGVVGSLLAGILIGERAAEQVDSVETVGMSVEEMAFKLFFASAVYALLAGGLVLLSVLGRLRGPDRERDSFAARERNAFAAHERDSFVTHDSNPFVTYLVVGTVPLAFLFVVFLLADVAGYHFRYFGAVMAFVTILGAVALVEGMATVSRYAPAIPLLQHAPSIPIRTVVVILLAILLPLSLLTVYFSPYILRGSGHVTEQRLAGYETAFEHRESDIAYVGIRTGPDREAHAVQGTEVAEDGDLLFESEGIPPPVFDTNLSVHYERDRYVPIHDSSYQVEVELYDGFRYSEDGFRSLDTTPGIDRVQSNGEFRLYRVNNATGEAASTG